MSAQLPFALDLDGVLVDFQRASYDAHGVSYDVSPSRYDYWVDWGMSNNQFWSRISELGTKFWSELPVYHWTSGLLRLIGSNFLVATAPCQDPNSVAGKIEFIQKFFGRDFRHYMVTPVKQELAKTGRVLIDDSDDVCDDYRANGGRAILFPQPWNRNRQLIPYRLGYVRKAIFELAALA